MRVTKILPAKLNIGDTIGVVAPSNPIIGYNIVDLYRAKEIAEKGNTCVVKEYFIDDRYQEKIEKKEYNAIYQFLKTN